MAQTNKTQRKGAALVVAIILLSTFMMLAVVFASATDTELQQTANFSRGADAQLAAESGLSYMRLILDCTELPSSTDADNMLDTLHSHLNTNLGGTDLLAGQYVTKTETSVVIPEIQLPRGSFSCTLTPVSFEGGHGCDMLVVGRFGSAQRRIAMRFEATNRTGAVFDYGIASKGKIYISGSALIDGMNRPDEAKILSCRTEPVAIEAGGHATIGGELNVTGAEQDYVFLKGSVSVAGETDLDKILANHVNFSTEEPEFPEIDPTPFIPLATNVVDADTDFNGSGNVFTNIRVKAGTNPNFKNDTVINGVLYIESPNVVTFHSKVTINGIIITEEADIPNLTDNNIQFRGQASAPGVDALPDTEEFAALKEQRGTVMLAPGFSVEFRGNTNSVNGVIAADQLSFQGNSDISGELSGVILGLKDVEMSLKGNSTIKINRDGMVDLPAGFKHPVFLEPNLGTYREPSASSN